jgi:hypothetical protein
MKNWLLQCNASISGRTPKTACHPAAAADANPIVESNKSSKKLATKGHKNTNESRFKSSNSG